MVLKSEKEPSDLHLCKYFRKKIVYPVLIVSKEGSTISP